MRLAAVLTAVRDARGSRRGLRWDRTFRRTWGSGGVQASRAWFSASRSLQIQPACRAMPVIIVTAAVSLRVLTAGLHRSHPFVDRVQLTHPFLVLGVPFFRECGEPSADRGGGERFHGSRSSKNTLAIEFASEIALS